MLGAVEGAAAPGVGTVMYETVTKGIKVSVTPHYLEEQSSPADDHYVWAYSVRIANESERVVQLKTRHWRITDANGVSQEVRGPGVVGEQPVLSPGEVFEYTSGTPLSTPSGMMMGAYQMEASDGAQFDVAIPAFSLDSPHQAIQLN